MVKHDSITTELFESTAQRYMDFFSKFLNEYADFGVDSISTNRGYEGFISFLQRVYALGVEGKVVEGNLLPCDLEDISTFEKLEPVLGLNDEEALCSTLSNAVHARIKLCLHQKIPMGDVYELPEHFDDFAEIFGLDLTIRELAALANMGERSVRNALLEDTDAQLYKTDSGEQLVKVDFAAQWLRSRKDFKPTKNLSGMVNLEQDYVNVPVAADGTLFDHSCEYKRGGFTIGEKGDEIKVATYDEALRYLTSMHKAKWRRPNAAGNYGIVSAVEWIRISRDQL